MTSAPVRAGLTAFIRAATPETCGVAMVVPLLDGIHRLQVE